jgi:hypothetical protein
LIMTSREGPRSRRGNVGRWRIWLRNRSQFQNLNDNLTEKYITNEIHASA